MAISAETIRDNEGPFGGVEQASRYAQRRVYEAQQAAIQALPANAAEAVNRGQDLSLFGKIKEGIGWMGNKIIHNLLPIATISALAFTFGPSLLAMGAEFVATLPGAAAAIPERIAEAGTTALNGFRTLATEQLATAGVGFPTLPDPMAFVEDAYLDLSAQLGWVGKDFVKLPR